MIARRNKQVGNWQMAVSKLKSILISIAILLCSSLNISAKESAEIIFNKANTLFQKQDFEGAVKTYKEVLQFDSTSDEVWFNLANASRIGSGEARFLAVNYSSLNKSIEFQPYSRNARAKSFRHAGRFW